MLIRLRLRKRTWGKTLEYAKNRMKIDFPRDKVELHVPIKCQTDRQTKVADKYLIDTNTQTHTAEEGVADCRESTSASTPHVSHLSRLSTPLDSRLQ